MIVILDSTCLCNLLCVRAFVLSVCMRVCMLSVRMYYVALSDYNSFVHHVQYICVHNIIMCSACMPRNLLALCVHAICVHIICDHAYSKLQKVN